MSRLDPARWRRVNAILEQYLEAPEEDREAVLAAATAGDPALAAEVRTLLSHAAREAGPLDGDAAGRFGHLLAEAAGPDGEGEAGATAERLAGREIGGYRIVDRLGEGGMGVVFAARQSHPGRTVALKVLRAGVYADEHQLRQFRREAESLGRLSHPGIAAIFDAGRTDEGLHWFAMERVVGRPLDQWLRERPVGTARAEVGERVALFLELCDAISHAHQRGVVHLDLKPSNIMVPDPPTGSASGTQAGVKVLDFGIAKLAAAEGVAATGTIGARGPAGTLAYMSPEQASGDARDLDVRSDIYALGAILFELLTGRLPLDLQGLALPEATRRIAEARPARPGEVNRALRGDLETIILKALAKDPEQRYQSAAALAEDLRRWRDDLPILGRAPSTAYQLRKIVARHRVVLAFACALALSVTAALVGTGTGLLRARRAEQALRQEVAAADRTVEFLESVFAVNDPGESRGNAVTARELLDRAAADVDTQLVDQPRLKGRLLGSMGTAYRKLGLYGQARPLLEKAVALDETALADDDPRLGLDHYVLAGLLRRLGDYDAARGHYERALEVRRLALPADDPDVVASLSGLANLHIDEGRYPEAIALYHQVLATLGRTLGPDHPKYSLHLANLSLAFWGQGQADSACVAMEEVVARQRRILPADDLDLAWSLHTLASYYTDLGRADEAWKLADEALRVEERKLGPGHPDLAVTLDVLANLSRQAGRHAEACGLHERALAIFAGAMGTTNARYAMELDHLARDDFELGNHRQAVEAARRAGAILAATLPPDHPSRAMNRLLLAHMLAGTGQAAEARALLEQALAAREGADDGEARLRLEILVELARVEAQLGRAPAARERYAQALQLVKAGADTSGFAAVAPAAMPGAAMIAAEMATLGDAGGR